MISPESLRVLVVEDDSRFHSVIESVVISAFPDADVKIVVDYDSALAEAIFEYYDVLILDLVLHGAPSGAQEDWEGLWLLAELHERGLGPHIPVIVLTGHADVPVARELFAEYGVRELLEKSAPERTIKEAFQRVVERTRTFGLETRVELSPDITWPSIVQSMGHQFWRISADCSEEQANLELHHIIPKLFDNVQRVQLSPLRGAKAGASGAGIIVATPYDVQDRKSAAVIIKFGSLESIQKEYEGWKVLRPKMHGQRLTQIEGIVLGRRLGAIRYSIIGATEVRALDGAYTRMSASDLDCCIRSLFEESCPLFYENRVPKRFNVEEEYSRSLGFNRERIAFALKQRFPENPIQASMIQFPGVPRKFRHAIAEYCSGSGTFEGLQHGIESLECPTHGDLHSGNVFVDREQKYAWLIDFGRSGQGHWARDFVELETCLKFQHLPTFDLPSFMALEHALLGPDRLSDEIVFGMADGTDTVKVASGVGAVRGCAHRLLGNDTSHLRMLDYYWALFFQTINYLRMYKLINSPLRKNRVLLSAAMIYEKIASLTLLDNGAGQGPAIK